MSDLREEFGLDVMMATVEGLMRLEPTKRAAAYHWIISYMNDHLFDPLPAGPPPELPSISLSGSELASTARVAGNDGRAAGVETRKERK